MPVTINSYKSTFTDNNFWSIFSFLSFLIIIFILAYPYFNSVVLTNLYLDKEPDFKEVCNQETGLKFVQVIEYKPQFSKSKIDCIYKDSSKNIRLELFYRDNQWVINKPEKLNQRNRLYWPIFL